MTHNPNPFKQLNLILKGGHVVRFHTKPTLKEETVAEHSYLVAWLTTMVLPTLPRAELLLAALAHDLPEYVLGDLPSPAKKSMGLGDLYRREEDNLFRAAGMPNYEAILSAEEAEVLKFCDNLAGYLKCRYEAQMGNRTLNRVIDNYRDYINAQIENSVTLPKQRCELLMAYANSEHLLTEDE